MSSSNFVHVGKVAVPEPGKGVGEVIVGVRADLGRVIVSSTDPDGRRGAMRPLTPEETQKVAGHMMRAAGVAASLSEAHRVYAAALQQAEADLAAAFAREVSA
ncbi:hypothetical protein FGG30_gp058 [Mycobacterium phage Pixie]|uniref:Uncharacterized protein n=1 Tax=Mycobacterium phage Pixie TaxID=2922215 RepID=G1D4W7_9CAUD|nr:hypothetical protein FGG30_gp058 [Mycobacterium phage Pixie]AEK09870.1 hypothetical protein PBI_PIXIE_58 [Mycobacterium phage Pixie]